MKLNIFIGAVFIGLLSSCDTEVDRLAPEATKVTNKFYGYLKEQKIDSTVSLFSGECLVDTPPDSIVAMLTRMNMNHGDVRSATLEQNGYSTNIKEGKSQKEFTQTYKVVYASGFTTKEEFHFRKDEKGSSIGRIYSYVIDFY